MTVPQSSAPEPTSHADEPRSVAPVAARSADESADRHRDSPGEPPRSPTPAGRRGRRIVSGVVGLFVLAAAALALPMVRAMSRPVPPSDVGTVKPTVDGRYRVVLATAEAPVPLNRVHRWTVRIEPTATGSAPGAAARSGPLTVTVDGGMPQHGHGLPTAPRVTGRLPDGRLVVDGVKFSMPGWWELRVRVAGAAGADSVTFNLVL